MRVCKRLIPYLLYLVKMKRLEISWPLSRKKLKANPFLISPTGLGITLGLWAFQMPRLAC